MRRLEMYYDYECPFCWKAFQSLREVLGDFPDIEPDFRPLVLRVEPGYSFRSRSSPVNQLFLLAHERGVDPILFNERVYDLVHVDGADIGDPKVLAEKLAVLLPAEDMLRALEQGSYKTEQEAANEAFDLYKIAYLPIFRLDGRQLSAAGGEAISPEKLRRFLSA